MSFSKSQETSSQINLNGIVIQLSGCIFSRTAEENLRHRVKIKIYNKTLPKYITVSFDMTNTLLVSFGDYNGIQLPLKSFTNSYWIQWVKDWARVFKTNSFSLYPFKLQKCNIHITAFSTPLINVKQGALQNKQVIQSLPWSHPSSKHLCVWVTLHMWADPLCSMGLLMCKAPNAGAGGKGKPAPLCFLLWQERMQRKLNSAGGIEGEKH